MKKRPGWRLRFTARLLLSALLCSAGLCLAFIGLALVSGPSLSAQGAGERGQDNGPKSVVSYKNDTSPPLRELPQWSEADRKEKHEANENPKIPHRHKDEFDPIVQHQHVATLSSVSPSVAAVLTNFDGIPFPGVGCNCAPPDTNGAV